MGATITALPTGDSENALLKERVNQLESENARLRASAQLASDVLRKVSSPSALSSPKAAWA